AANRVETLTIDRGEKLVLYGQGALLGGQGSRDQGIDAPRDQEIKGSRDQGAEGSRIAASSEQSKIQNPKSRIEGADSQPTTRKAAEPRIASYVCTLDGGVVADQEEFVGGWSRRKAGLQADELRMVFDVGGGNDDLMGLRDKPR